MDRRRRVLMIAVAGVLLLGLLGGGAGAAAPAGTVVASGLANPRGLVVLPDGTLYVAEAGTSGDEAFTPPAPYPPSTRGTSGRVTRIAPGGAKTTVVGNLPSLSLGGNDNPFVLGAQGLVSAGGALWLATGAMPNGHPPAPNAGVVLRIDAQTGATSQVADLAAFERANNPDGYELTANPYGLARGADGALYVADAGANTLLRVDPRGGQVGLVTAFGGVPGPGPNPQRGGKSERDPVPGGLALGPDGALYVALLTGFPVVPGSSTVLRVSPAGTVSEVVAGLTAATGVAFGPDGRLYVTEYGQFDQVATGGRVLRVTAAGGTEVVADGLSSPNFPAFDARGNLYVAVNSNTAPSAGAPGQVLRFDGVAAPATPGMPNTGAGGGRQRPAAPLALLGLAALGGAGLLVRRGRRGLPRADRGC